MVGWSYKQETFGIMDVPKLKFEERLSELGREGWELIAAIPHDRGDINSHVVHLVFKRPSSSAGPAA